MVIFTFRLPEGPQIRLRATVESRPKNVYYVKEICAALQEAHSALPPIQIKKVNGCWVHIDSGKGTDLATAIGKAIESNVIGQPLSKERD